MVSSTSRPSSPDWSLTSIESPNPLPTKTTPLSRYAKALATLV